jgi:hypothetical protein
MFGWMMEFPVGISRIDLSCKIHYKHSTPPCHRIQSNKMEFETFFSSVGKKEAFFSDLANIYFIDENTRGIFFVVFLENVEKRERK